MQQAIEAALQPGCFLVASGHQLRMVHQRCQEIPWELFGGHLLDESKTRQRKAFRSWNVYLDSSTAPLISVRYDFTEGRLYVTRGILSYVWQTYEERRDVIQAREAQEWKSELVGTIDVSYVASDDFLRRQVADLILIAVVGVSRLPTSSLESPMPQFALGQLGYTSVLADETGDRPVSDPLEFLRRATDRSISLAERAKILESSLRAADKDQVRGLASGFLQIWQDAGWGRSAIPPLIIELFNRIALTPYTGFVDCLLLLLEHWTHPELLGPREVIDLLSYMLRHLARHLTAYDLVSFHNLGAEYSDGLLLDALLKAYLRLIEQHPDEFDPSKRDTNEMARAKRIRRRALRQAWLVRKQNEGRRVPATPTSWGESHRVLPPPFARVTQQEILDSGLRPTSLFDRDPIDQSLSPSLQRTLEQSVSDLEYDTELQELGAATFLDRPLGVFKHAAEIDRTPLLTYHAFSEQMVHSRLKAMGQWSIVSSDPFEAYVRKLENCAGRGFPVSELLNGEPRRVVSLEDAYKSAADFRFLRTARDSLDEFLKHYDLEPLRARFPGVHRWLFSSRSVLLIRSNRASATDPDGTLLTAFDSDMRPRIELGLAQLPWTPSIRYQEQSGREYLEDGLCLMSVAGEPPNAEPTDFRQQRIVLPPMIGQGYS